MTSNYKSLPTLAAYIDRVGAEESNFRRFLIKEQKGKYYTERCTIRILDDGSIYVNNIEHAPSEEEAKAIKEEIVKSQKEHPDRWPRSCRDAINLTKLKIPKDDNLFVFWDRERKHIIMCQQRIDLKNGGKYYKPWTFFSDGVWRDMEPDGQLPFWKPPVCRNKCKIMIHEGAKPAVAMDSLVNDLARKKELKAHPWGEELAEYEHWGMIGGAQVPHRADYKELHAESPLMEAVYVCDRDYDGESALQKVSKYYGRSMKGLKFSNEFSNSKPGWDMADPLPASLFKGKKWTGGPLRSYMCPATYATETAPVAKGAKGRPPLILKDVFAQEWIHSITPDVYIHRDWPDQVLGVDQFDDKVGAYSDAKVTSDLVKKNDAIKAVEIKYVPGKEPGFFVDSGRYFNTHCPGEIREQKGDPRPFTDFMDYLFPVEFDKIEVMRWVATLIARPDIKMLYALLLISETQGVGKGTLAERILEPILGRMNVSSVDESEVVDSQYTYWQAHKRLAIIHEIYAGHNSKAYNKLKSIITDKTIRVKQKFLAPYDLENWLHIIASSNNFNALKLTMEDRRWLIPKVTETKRPASYWLGFNNWLNYEDGLGIIMSWARAFLEKNEPVVPGQDAPRTEAKGRAVEDAYSDGQLLVGDILKTIKRFGGKGQEWERCIILDVDLVGLIKDTLYDGRQIDRLERPRTVRITARDCGWFLSQERIMLRDGTIGRLVCLEESDADRPHTEVLKEVRPTRIRKLGKRLLCVEDGEILNVRRAELEDETRSGDRKIVPFPGGKKD